MGESKTYVNSLQKFTDVVFSYKKYFIKEDIWNRVLNLADLLKLQLVLHFKIYPYYQLDRRTLLRNLSPRRNLRKITGIALVMSGIKLILNVVNSPVSMTSLYKSQESFQYKFSKLVLIGMKFHAGRSVKLLIRYEWLNRWISFIIVLVSIVTLFPNVQSALHFKNWRRSAAGRRDFHCFHDQKYIFEAINIFKIRVLVLEVQLLLIQWVGPSSKFFFLLC